MSDCSHLPIWVSYFQALAAPIFAAVVAVVGTLIAAQQMWIARDKLQHDAFDRRYDRRVAVYEATRKFLADVFQENISENEIRVYGLHTLDAQFLFDEALYRYLRQIRDRVAAWRDANSSMEHLPPGDERNEFSRLRTDNLNWIIQQGDDKTGFAVKFRPFLVDVQVKRSWWFCNTSASV